MKIITQNQNEIELNGDISMRANCIYLNDILLGRYSSCMRTCDIFAEITCHEWNKDCDVYTMPSA